MSNEEDKWSRARLLEEVRHASDQVNLLMQITLAYLPLGAAFILAIYALPDAAPWFIRASLGILGVFVLGLAGLILLRPVRTARNEYHRLKAKL